MLNYNGCRRGAHRAAVALKTLAVGQCPHGAADVPARCGLIRPDTGSA